MSHSLFRAQALAGADLRKPWPHAQRKKTNSFVALFLHIRSPLLTLHQPADLAMSVPGAIVVKNNLHETLRNDAMAKTPSQTAFIGPSDDAPVATYVNALFGLAVRRRASDIHLEPQKRGLTIRLRIDGLLQNIPSPAHDIAHRLCARIKVMAAMDIAERRLPQDCRFTANCGGQPLDLRVSSLPTLWGEKLVLRLVPNDTSILALADLGLSGTQHRDFLNALSKPQGLILVTGPTGSGKTLTLYSALQQLNTPHRNISTVEEPIEIPMAGINQIGIKPQIGLGFAETLRALLRQDPDVLMVGEIRDTHTASMAIRAAQTGHLVLSTVHTKSAIATLMRLNQLGLSDRDVVESVTLILAQRLLRLLCTHCKIPATTICASNPIQAVSSRYQANLAGCEHCLQGYWGRIGIFELCQPEALGDAVPPVRHGYEDTQNLRDMALGRYDAGDTSLDEVNRVVPAESDFGVL